MKVELNNYKELDEKRASAYKTLCTNITFAGKDVHVIAVTSTLPDEGKSEVAFNIANTFAKEGKKTLIIDADNRRSIQLKRFGVSEDVKGLTYFLTEKEDKVSEIICETNLDNLSFIFAGPRIPDPAEAFSSGQFKSMLDELRDQYDYVVIDCPPLGAVLDASIVAKECDGALIVIEQGRISHSQAEEIKEQLERSKVNILGTVLNKVSSQKRSSDYGYSYGDDE